MTEGKKFDSDKPRTDLLPPDTLEALASILTSGAAKYGPRNWEKGMCWGRVYGAALRHLMRFWQGYDTDPESGLPHIDHALCNVMFLATYARRVVGTDDRKKLGEMCGDEKN